MSIPKTMKAAILVEQKKPLVVDEVKLPESLDYGQVLVKISCSGICGSQIGEIMGVKGPDRFLPHLLGHEASGTVVEVGPGVKTVANGDTVVLHWMKGNGIEGAPPAYQWKGEKCNAGWITTFNEYAIVSENRVTTIPEGTDDEVAALFGCAVTTGLGIVVNNAKVKIGESVVVIGAGGVGLNVVQGAALVSANPIVAVDLYDHKLELAQKFGATHAVNSKNDGSPFDSIRAILKETTGQEQADVVIDNTGVPEIIQNAYELTKPKGRTILVGVPRKGANVSIYSLPLHFGKTLSGSHGGETDPVEDIPRYMNLYRSGTLQLKELITDHFTLDEINTAIDKMRSGEITGRCIVRM